MIYFDNAATAWPKPAVTAQAMLHYMEQVGGNPGRSGHRLSIEAARILFAAREGIAGLFNAPDPQRVVFTANVTEALNLALSGLLGPGDHVITSGLEHNSVMRPLRALQGRGTAVTVVPCDRYSRLDPAQVEAAIQPNTRLVAINHASNVTGTLLPVEEIGNITRRHGLLLLTDEAQTGGAYPVDLQAAQIDLLAFTGHKALYGPTGTGGLIVGESVDTAGFTPLKYGGTGSRSDSEEQPAFLPDRLESGTPNIVGLAGLAASLEWLAVRGIDSVRAHEVELCRRLLEGLLCIPGVEVYGEPRAETRTATAAFNIRGMTPSEVGLRMDDEFDILCRVGLHCSPAAHKTLGTFPVGAVRFGLGLFNTADEVDSALRAVERLAQEARR
jgi:cysteine desulfurase / selenocysteine lyase